ncbi:hypothetical protein CLV63_12379 [Murinocardiopsis flavida]|uniref:DUF1449 family protein n=1 Tax=Murinocardiopsis flavida TaxID=645275 RepID=A0A2P8CZ68_9ACTN|nr:hypothetical protein [Murinocardiopsis flavida]PSK90250.1 hypothetical protein CLV63_12379 [Murinocardiopsis flavida]
MGAFVQAALGFPTVLFTFSLVVVVAYWVLVLVGGAEVDMLDGDVPDSGGAIGLLGGIGLGGVPGTVSVSLVIAVAWFLSLSGASLATGWGLSPTWLIVILVGVLALALMGAWLVTAFIVMGLRKALPDARESSLHDFVGRTCTIRTGKVTMDFGQAEAASEDGSTSVIQVRQHGDDPLTAGSTALVYAYDDAGEFFWVSAFDPALDPNR